MKIERGNVINARFPHASGARGKKRPVVVVQTNDYNRRLHHAIVAQLTTNLADQGDPACFLIEVGTPAGRAAGITQDSLFSAYLLALMSEDRLQDVIGKLPDEIMQAPAIPRTLSGKKQEVPMKKLFLGHPQEKVINREIMANPHCVDWYIERARAYADS